MADHSDHTDQSEPSAASSSTSGNHSSTSAPSTSDSALEQVQQDSTVSFVDRLRCPKPSELARKRKVACNPPPRGKRKSYGGRGTSGPKSITPRQRASEHPEECLTVSNKKLFCKACREELSLISSVINNHIKSAKHLAGKERLKSKEKSEQDIAESLKASDQVSHPVGETLPQDQRVYRVKVVTAFLRAAIPLFKLDSLRELLEENGYRLSDRRHMTDIVPLIFSQEQARIKEELSGKDLSVIFDGTTRLGEAMAIVVRFIDSDWQIQQRLIRFQLIAQSMSGEEVAREVITALSTQYSINSSSLLAAMRDRASVNDVAIRTIKVVYPALLDVGCFSHTLDLVGGKFNTPHLSDFMTAWVSLFSHSPKARLLWREQTGRSVLSYSPTRWWSRWELMKQLLELYGDLESFIRRHDDLGPATRKKLLQYLDDPSKKGFLQLELAVIVDAGMPFVQATYKLEGDGPLALECYEVISSLTAAVNMTVPHYPNLQAVARSLSGGNQHIQQQLLRYATACVQPGVQYFNERLNSSMKIPLAAFKAARLFSPVKIQEMQPDCAAVDSLSSLPFLDANTLGNLKSELPQYIAAVEDLNPSYNALDFWKSHTSSLPAWAAAARKALLVQPSSAASERVFSLLNNSFGSQQNNCLQDYIETSLMLQYNKH